MSLKYTCPGCGTPLGYEGLCWKCKCEEDRHAALAWTPEQIAEKQKNLIQNIQRLAEMEDFYDENVVFLRFCFEKELLKKNPLDRQGRILRMVYLNQDLTKAGKYLFPRLMQKFLVFTDRKGKTRLETMLKRWYTALEKEYRSQTAE